MHSYYKIDPKSIFFDDSCTSGEPLALFRTSGYDNNPANQDQYRRVL